MSKKVVSNEVESFLSMQVFFRKSLTDTKFLEALSEVKDIQTSNISIQMDAIYYDFLDDVSEDTKITPNVELSTHAVFGKYKN